MTLLLRPYRQELGRVGGDYLVLRIARDDLDGDVLQAREEEPLPHSRLKQEKLLLICEIEGFLQEIDVGGRLLHQELERRVRKDGFAVWALEKVPDVLGDSRNAKVILASAFGDREEEARRVFSFHHPPRLVYDEQALLELVAYRIPDVMGGDIHSHRLQLVLHIAHREDDELLVDINVRRLVQKACPCTTRVLR